MSNLEPCLFLRNNNVKSELNGAQGMLKQPRSDVVPLGHLGVRRSFAKGTAAVLLTSLMVTAPATATAEDTITSKAAADPAVISEWNEIAQKTLLADTKRRSPQTSSTWDLCAPPSTTP